MEDDSLAKLPRWKREKVLKEREMKAAKEAEDELQSRLNEEMEWAENLKNQEVVRVTPVLKDNKAAEKEKAEKEKKEEAKELKEKEKKKSEEEDDSLAKLPRWKREKVLKEREMKAAKEAEDELQSRLNEEMEWAENLKNQE